MRNGQFSALVALTAISHSVLNIIFFALHRKIKVLSNSSLDQKIVLWHVFEALKMEGAVPDNVRKVADFYWICHSKSATFRTCELKYYCLKLLKCYWNHWYLVGWWFSSIWWFWRKPETKSKKDCLGLYWISLQIFRDQWNWIGPINFLEIQSIKLNVFDQKPFVKRFCIPPSSNF